MLYLENFSPFSCRPLGKPERRFRFLKALRMLAVSRALGRASTINALHIDSGKFPGTKVLILSDLQTYISEYLLRIFSCELESSLKSDNVRPSVRLSEPVRLSVCPSASSSATLDFRAISRERRVVGRWHSN